MSKRYYLAYGSNLNMAQMKKRCPTAKVVGSAKLEGYVLVFRGVNGNAYATVEKSKGRYVPVLMWELQPEDETSLDVYEGYPRFYEKEYVDIEINSETVQAMMYVMVKGRSTGAPSSRYYEIVSEGYMTSGFDSEVLTAALKESV